MHAKQAARYEHPMILSQSLGRAKDLEGRAGFGWFSPG